MGRAEGHVVGWHVARRATSATQPSANCERRDSQQDGLNASGRAASEERAATSVRRAGGEAAVWALDSALNMQIWKSHESSAQTAASAEARFAGRDPFLTLRRCAGELAPCFQLDCCAYVARMNRD